jgi:hypothetical protein
MQHLAVACVGTCDYGLLRGYEQIAQSFLRFAVLDTETCRLSGVRFVCTSCQPGRYGPVCGGICPGGIGNVCNQHGTCHEGVSGDGQCQCAPAYAGLACDQCAADHYGYPTCTYCLAETTCSSNGVCMSNGACSCDTGFGGADCSDQCGDVDDDGSVGTSDVDAFRLFLADPAGAPLSPAGVSKCSVVDDAGPCEILDVTVIRRALAVPSLEPGIEPVCTAVAGG